MTREALSLRRALTNRPEDHRLLALEPVDVAVLDSGIDATHADLADRIAPALRVDMIEGAATLVEVAGPTNQDVFGHGTAVASLIAKTAPNARIIDIRVLGSDNKGAGDALLAGLTAAVERKIKIINMSLAATAKFAPQLAALCDTAYRQGQIVVAAKRNMPLADNGYPAELSASISVDRMKLESLSRIVYRANAPIEYCAHGEDVVVAAPGGGYTTKTGTSFATPVVSGMCALLLGAYPDLRPFEVKAILKAFAEDQLGSA